MDSWGATKSDHNFGMSYVRRTFSEINSDSRVVRNSLCFDISKLDMPRHKDPR